jgi:hypothetical protein
VVNANSSVVVSKTGPQLVPGYGNFYFNDAARSGFAHISSNQYVAGMWRWCRAYYYFTSNPLHRTYIALFADTGWAGTYLSITTAGALAVSVAPTAENTVWPAIALNQWIRIELGVWNGVGANEAYTAVRYAEGAKLHSQVGSALVTFGSQQTHVMPTQQYSFGLQGEWDGVSQNHIIMPSGQSARMSHLIVAEDDYVGAVADRGWGRYSPTKSSFSPY